MTLNDQVQRRFGATLPDADSGSLNTTIEGILNHRSHRSFIPDPVPESLMQLVFSAAFSAPSKSDLQQCSVIRVLDKSKQYRIAALSRSTQWISEAPQFMVWCGDSRRIRRLSEWRGHKFANDHLDAFMNAAVDAGIAMQTFIIAAESAGLGCCPVSQVRDNISKLSAELKLPDWVFPVAGLCVGWPAENPPISMRLPLSTTIHHDEYTDDGLLQEVSEYDRRREAGQPTSVENQRMAEKFGSCADYGWSENRTRQYSVPARADFGRYIRSQEFKLD